MNNHHHHFLPHALLHLLKHYSHSVKGYPGEDLHNHAEWEDIEKKGWKKEEKWIQTHWKKREWWTKVDQTKEHCEVIASHRNLQYSFSNQYLLQIITLWKLSTQRICISENGRRRLIKDTKWGIDATKRILKLHMSCFIKPLPLPCSTLFDSSVQRK